MAPAASTKSIARLYFPGARAYDRATREEEGMAEGKRASDANKELLRRFYDEVVNQGNLDLIDELLTEDFVEHEEFPGLEQNREGVKQFFAMLRTAFPDLSMTVEHVVAEGDLAVANVRVRGTHQGEFMGVPATGKQIDVREIDLIRFRDEVATEHWGAFDAMGMMVQLGAMPG
jgi:steroid delta-isomerase-like uncharacterized protein